MGEVQPATPCDPATPAARIIRRFGVKTLSAWTGRHPSRVHAWAWSPAKGGTGGAIPKKARERIIAGAKAERGEHIAYVEFEPQPGEAYLSEDGS